MCNKKIDILVSNIAIRWGENCKSLQKMKICYKTDTV